MATQTLTTFTTARIDLGTTDELYIGRTGELVTSLEAIYDTGAGSHEITILGSVVSTDGTGVSLTTATFVEFLAGPDAIINSQGGDAALFNASTTIVFQNLGTMTTSAGAYAVTLAQTDGAAIIDFFNSGTILGSGGVYLESGTVQTTFSNSGTIEGHSANAVLYNSSSATYITNTGTLTSHGNIGISGTGIAHINNTGVITGQTNAIQADSLADTVLNSGQIFGDVVLGSGADTYRGLLNGFVAGAVSGQNDNDTLIGANGDDTLNGDAGDDYLRGGTGADQLDGGTNNDSILGDAGDDILLGGSENDTLRGGTGDDSLDGGSGNDSLFGNTGDDTLLGDLGNDTMFGGAGEDSMEGGDDADVLNGGEGIDEIYGNADTDTLRGDGGNDILNGGAGADVIQGGEGNDLLIGGLDKDILNGGLGADVFRFTATNQSAVGANRDVIQDFEVGVDTIDLGAMPGVLTYVGGAALPGGGTAAVRAVVVGVNTLVQIDTDGNGTIDSEILLSFTSGVTADDFIL